MVYNSVMFTCYDMKHTEHTVTIAGTKSLSVVHQVTLLNTLAQTNTMVTKLCGRACIHYNKCTAIMITVKGCTIAWYTNITPQLKHQESIVVQSNAVIINSCT